jgi:hypothetical protein
MISSLITGLMDVSSLAGGTLLGIFKSHRDHVNTMETEREKTKRYKFKANLTDIQLARENKSTFTFIERYTVILLVVGMITIGLFIGGMDNIPINIPISTRPGFIGRLWYGAEHTSIVTVHGLYIMEWLQYPLFWICGFLFGGRR